MNFNRSKRRYRMMSEINITPLTDVMLVLLVVFMVTTPLIMKASIDIKLPEAHAKSTVPSQTIEIFLTADREIYIDQKRITEAALVGELKMAFGKSGDSQVVISADQRVDYGHAVRILDLARQAGAAKLMLTAQPPLANNSEMPVSQNP
jgi:biopolymer transport protein ExbD